MNEIDGVVPIVSVVIPTYNRAKLIGKTLRSVLGQSYDNFEIIVVDDGSTDNTKDVVNKFKDERIRYIRHEKNKGAPTARNTGIKAAKGEYIAFQDSDDEWLPQKLEKQMKAFENAPQKLGVVYTGLTKIVDDTKEYIPYSWVAQKEGDIHKELLKGNFIATPSIVVRKECFEKVGMFDRKLPRLQDYELALRLSKYYEFKFIDEPLLISPGIIDSISTSEAARIKALEIILKKHLNDFLEDEKSLSKYYFSIGIYKCLNSKIFEGESYLKKAFELNSDTKILSTHYFTIGRRLYLNKNIRDGRAYLTKAIKAYPMNLNLLIVYTLSFLRHDIYKKIYKIYKKYKIS